DFCLTPVDPAFPARAKEKQGGILVAGENYGQGSSREHAALVPLYLGVRAVIAKSFARIHMANLINSGILPLVFDNAADYDGIEEGDALVIEDAPAQIASGGSIVVKNVTRGTEFATSLNVSQRLRDIILAGGLILYTRAQAE
ncbi:MAG: aconitate hydratase, partial [Clostridia bacterium]|nr:aconitate hydratase [Clostridia bacterium]